MDINDLKALLTAVSTGETSVANATDRLKNITAEDIDFAHIDHHRSLRKGFPEVIFGEGKTPEQIKGIMEKMIPQENIILVTRVDAEKAQKVISEISDCHYHEAARMIVWKKKEIPVTGNGNILVISAGTSDLPVAMEAALTAEAMGNSVETIIDVGVAGIHRLFRYREKIEAASILIVVAGMEGALPSVVAGMVKSPVIAVPTSIGYGVTLNGMTALFGMLNSCSSNIAVVNIDNGFGAGYMASSINHITIDD